ncbi:MAG: hypothetical protein RL220_973 [Bacteroidota bacterium]
MVSGGSWNMITVVLQVIIQLVYMMIMVRLLDVEAFAVMGVILGVLGFAEIFAQVGVGPALIQRKEVNQQHLNGAFYTAVIIGALFTCAFLISADWLGKIYQMPDLGPVMRVVCFSFIISALGAVPRSMMFKRMKFKSFFLASMISIVGGNLIVGLALAWMGYGIWAYAWALFAQNVLMTLAYWWFEPVTITRRWEWKSVNELMGYGAGSSLFNALNYLATRIDVTILPMFFAYWRTYPSAVAQFQAGLYERSAYVMGLPITVMGKLSDSVLFSGLSRIQEDPGALKKAMLRGTSLMAMIIIPASIFVMFWSAEILTVFLGERYAEASLTLQFLFLAVIFRTIARISDAMVRALNAVYRASVIKIVYCALIAAGVIIFSATDKEHVAAAIGLATFIHLVMNTALSMKLVAFSWKEFMLAQIPALFLSALILAQCFVLHWLGNQISENPMLVFSFATLSIAAITFCLVYFRPAILGGKESNPLAYLPERMKRMPVIRTMVNRI